MREILFKAKRIDNGEWVEGYLVETRHNTYHDGYRIIDKNGINYDELDYYEPSFISYIIDSSTICQCTGLKDKNGNLIWENDVLLQKTTEKHWCQWECMGVVKYGEHDWNVSEYGFTSIGFYIEPIVRNGNINKIACGLNQVDINDEFYPIEVIGNIFDNPELINE